MKETKNTLYRGAPKQHIYFGYRDDYSEDRQCDGVDFCIVPAWDEHQIIFDCNEFAIRCKDIKLRPEAVIKYSELTSDPKVGPQTRPVTLSEICRAGYVEYVDYVKQYAGLTADGRIKPPERIYLFHYVLKEQPRSAPDENFLRRGSTPDQCVSFGYRDDTCEARQSDGVDFCIVPAWDEQAILFYCHALGTYWKDIRLRSEDVMKDTDIPSGFDMRPATLSEIFHAGYVDYVDYARQVMPSQPDGKVRSPGIIHLFDYVPRVSVDNDHG